MKARVVHAPAALDNLRLEDRPDPGIPGAGEIRVRLRDSSLNFHDLGVVTGGMGSADGLVPLADGAGVVEAVGSGVSEFNVGDPVVSCFFPDWQNGAASIGDFSRTAGDGIDGLAQEYAVRPATAFTHAPKGLYAAEAATITVAGLTAWRALVVDGKLKAGDSVLLLGTGGVSIWALQIAKMMDARVAIISSSDQKLARAQTLAGSALRLFGRRRD